MDDSAESCPLAGATDTKIKTSPTTEVLMPLNQMVHPSCGLLCWSCSCSSGRLAVRHQLVGGVRMMPTHGSRGNMVCLRGGGPTLLAASQLSHHHR